MGGVEKFAEWLVPSSKGGGSSSIPSSWSRICKVAMATRMIAARRQVQVEVLQKVEKSLTAPLKVDFHVLSRMNRNTANSSASIATNVNKMMSSGSRDVSMTVEQR